MSLSLLPGIGELDPNSLSYAIYTQLYQHFFNAQDAGTIAEGDTTSIRLRNTAYGFAEAIAGGVAGEGSIADGGVLAGYLKRTGGQMSGPLGADYGFTAGIDNRRLLEMFRSAVSDSMGQVTSYDFGVRILGDLKVEGSNLYFGGQQFITYIGKLGTMFVRYPKMDFSSSSIRSLGEMYFGADKTSGAYLSTSALRLGGHDVYHAGNAGHAGADWTMKDATVAGVLKVDGSITLNGSLSALHGVTLGYGGNAFVNIAGEVVAVTANIDMRGGYAICFSGRPALSLSNTNQLQVTSPGGDLLLGAEPTSRVRLLAPLADEQGTRTLLTPTGGAWFPDSLRVAHGFSGDLLSTYRIDNIDQGIVVHERLRFVSQNDAFIQGMFGNFDFCSKSDHTDSGGILQEVHTFMGHIPSTSLLAPLNRSSDTFVIVSEADFILLGNRAEAETCIGIAGTLTRLEQQCLFFTDAHRLHSVAGGVKHYGQALFADGISSELFSSGLAGSGWAVLTNRTTGHAEATFDTLTVRRRMRVYEMEVQHSRTSNGSLWISDACSGDSVEKL